MDPGRGANALSAAARGPVAFVGDAHLVAGEPECTRAFVAFLESAPRRFSRLVLAGDIFDLWLARPHLHERHHVAVLEAVARARGFGLPVDYVVGNRDFGVESFRGLPFDRVGAVRLAGPQGEAWACEHGDLVNDADRSYRRWRAFARSLPVLGTFLALPAALAVPLSQRMERRMRTTNLAYKRRVPVEAIAARAERLFAATGARHLVLGHFHAEMRIPCAGGEALVLPDWKRSRRHAEWSDGRMRFVGPTDA